MPIAAPLAIGLGAASFLKWLAGSSANSDAMQKGYEALDKAQGAIQGAADKAISLNAPYMENAGPDFQRMRGLVQSGYFQTPYGQSFTPQQYAPSGFTFNPSQGMASFQPQSFQTNSFTPQGLPPLPPMPQAPPSQPPGQQLPPLPPRDQAMADAVRRASEADMLRNRGVPMNPSGGWNPQTGQGSPLTDMGVKPADPRIPDPRLLMRMRLEQPWLFGGSGPLEGGLLGRRAL